MVRVPRRATNAESAKGGKLGGRGYPGRTVVKARASAGMYVAVMAAGSGRIEKLSNIRAKAYNLFFIT